MANENETHEEVCEEMRSFGDVPPPMFAWRDLAERAEAAHKRELAAKDAEIAQLKSCLAGDCERMRLCAEPCANCHVELVNERDALIKELADALNSYLKSECIDCGVCCEDNGACVPQKNLRALVAKAREVCHV